MRTRAEAVQNVASVESNGTPLYLNIDQLDESQIGVRKLIPLSASLFIQDILFYKGNSTHTCTQQTYLNKMLLSLAVCKPSVQRVYICLVPSLFSAVTLS